MVATARSFDFPPYRPPSEANSMLLRVTHGCPWNKCAFCSMYKKYPFARKSMAEIKADIDMMPDVYGRRADNVFLGDSNSVLLSADDLVEILGHLYQVFPKLKRVTSYARAKTVLQKTPEELKRIRQAGLTRLHIGLESGSDEVLKLIRKGPTAAEIIEGSLKARAAGFECSLYVLLGIGGMEHTMDHRRGTVEVLNAVDPDFIRVRTLTPIPKSEIARWIAEGSFTQISPLVSLEEERDIVAGLEVHSRFLNDHASNIVPLDGKLPEDKERMLRIIDHGIAYCQENQVDYADYRYL